MTTPGLRLLIPNVILNGSSRELELTFWRIGTYSFMQSLGQGSTEGLQ